MPDRLPDLLVAGAMRSGTTSLSRYLGAHPEIAMGPKELGFFTDHFERGLEWYRDQLPSGTPLVGEATADYFARPTAMDRIQQTLPDAKLIVSLRNPVERTWSHYGLLHARGRDDRSFERAIDEESELLASGRASDGAIYLFHSLYDRQLERARPMLDDGRLHVTIFERLRSDPGKEYSAICQFLGVDPGVRPDLLGKAINPYVEFRSLRLRALALRSPAVMRRLVGRLNTRTVPPPDLPGNMRERLTDFFAPRVRRVEDLLGYSIPEWHA